MDLNPPEFWRCSAFTYADNQWGLVECEMCGATVRKEAKRPPEGDLVTDNHPTKNNIMVEPVAATAAWLWQISQPYPREPLRKG